MRRRTSKRSFPRSPERCLYVRSGGGFVGGCDTAGKWRRGRIAGLRRKADSPAEARNRVLSVAPVFESEPHLAAVGASPCGQVSPVSRETSGRSVIDGRSAPKAAARASPVARETAISTKAAARLHSPTDTQAGLSSTPAPTPGRATMIRRAVLSAGTVRVQMTGASADIADARPAPPDIAPGRGCLTLRESGQALMEGAPGHLSLSVLAPGPILRQSIPLVGRTPQ